MTIEVVKNLEGRRRDTGVDVDHGRVKCECACIAANVGGATMGARMNAKGRPPAELSCFIDGASASFELPASCFQFQVQCAIIIIGNSYS